MIFLNPLDKSLEAARIDFFLKTYIQFGFNTDEDFNLSLELVDLEVRVAGVHPFFVSDETVQSMQDKINAIESLVMDVVNGYTAAGIKLPLPSALPTKDLAGARLIPQDHYVLIEADLPQPSVPAETNEEEEETTP